MEDDLNCFSRTLVGDDGWEENLLQCRALIAQQAAPEVWTILGNDVESFRDKLAEWMDSFIQDPIKAWMAAKTYCDLVGLPGSEAYRACDRKSMRTLLGFMRKSLNAETNDETGEGKKKRRKSGPSEEEKEDWDMLFATVSRMSDHLDLEEVAEVFVNLGFKLNSLGALRWVESIAHIDRKRVALLKTLLSETLKVVHNNELTKDKSTWICSTISALTNDNDEYLLAFLQRLAGRLDVANQASRSKLVELIQMSVGTSAVRRRVVRYCGENLIVGDKSTKRIIACEIVSTLCSSGDILEVEILRNLAERTRDSVVTVRCAALRSIAILASRKSFILLEDNSCLLKSAIRSATSDERPGVRRWGIKVLALCPSLEEEALMVCMQRCRDVSISVRKAAVEALGCFIARYPNTAGEAFRVGVLPLVQDDEKTVSDAALLIVRDILLATQEQQEKDGLQSALTLLYAVRSEAEVDCLGIALKHIAIREDSASLFREFINAVASEAVVRLPSENEASRTALWGVWLVLEKCAEIHSLPSPKILSGDFLCEAWAAVRGMLTTTSTADLEEERVGACEAHILQRRILKVIREVQSSRLSSPKRLELGNNMLQDLAALDRPPEVMSEMLRLLVALCESEGKGTTVVREWGNTLKKLCESTLTRQFSSLDRGDVHVEEEDPNSLYTTAESALFLLGELAMMGYSPDNNNNNKLVEFSVDEPVTILVQALASPEFVLKSRRAGRRRNNLTRALAFLTLGKLCVRDDVLAKRCVTVFVKELSEDYGPGHDAVRCNALTVLGDLCRRFTNVVEPYVEKISRSLGDVSATVRKRCFLILSGLSQEEYIRLRPSLFYRLLACGGDEESDAVCQAAEYVLVSGFHRRYPTLFYQNAANLVFAMCGLSRIGYRPVDTDEMLLMDDVASLVGIQTRFLKHFASRDSLYSLILSRLDEAQKLEVCNKIRRDVFGGLLDGSIPLEQFDMNLPEEEMSAVTRVVMDSFKILESDYAKASAGILGKGGAGVMINDDGEETSQDATSSSTEAAVQRATLKIIDSLERKNLMENIIPLLVSLYSVASRERSSLVKLVVDHLKYLYERYRVECSSALAPHRDLHGLIQMELGVPLFTLKKTGKAAPLQFNVKQDDDNESGHSKGASVLEAKEKLKTPKLLRRVKAMMNRG